MKTSIRIGGPNTGGPEFFQSILELAVDAEKLGVDRAWSAEAWGMDAIAPLAYIAARTTRLELGTGIMQVCARTPASTAMTAMSMQTVSDGRFLLGLGNSGPQVVEGLHGQPFDRPLTRMRETVEIVRMATRGEKLAFDGKAFALPRRGGQGKALRLAQPPVEVPIHLATLTPRALEMTGEIADGWLGTSFTPDVAEAHLAHLRRGAQKSGRKLSDLELCVDVSVAITDDPEPLIQSHKPSLAFQLSAMGSPTMNFYNDAYARSGFEDACREVRDLWLAGDREASVRAVPDEMVRATTLIGDDARVRERVRLYRDVGIGELMLHPWGRHATARLDMLGRAIEIVRQESPA
ncbi:MAG: LLM class flavin-dependent oxidoreductase [Myxococcales bacterium]|nr:LLM class flavin-dependent oxidoreductase [Myxococcales bacterium]